MPGVQRGAAGAPWVPEGRAGGGWQALGARTGISCFGLVERQLHPLDVFIVTAAHVGSCLPAAERIDVLEETFGIWARREF